jgi:hypothetical protein
LGVWDHFFFYALREKRGREAKREASSAVVPVVPPPPYPYRIQTYKTTSKGEYLKK